MIISIINDTELKKEEVQRVIRAVNRQMAEDFKRYWHRDVQLRLEGWTGEQPNPSIPIDMRGDAVIYLWDKENIGDALGYHDLTAAGVPFGFVFTRLSEANGEDWSVTLSHEVLELAMDPEVNLLAEGPHPDPLERGRTVYHWYELCDAVQGTTYRIDGIDVEKLSATMKAEMLMAMSLGTFENAESESVKKKASRTRAASTPRPSARGLSQKLRSVLVPG